MFICCFDGQILTEGFYLQYWFLSLPYCSCYYGYLFLVASFCSFALSKIGARDMKRNFNIN